MDHYRIRVASKDDACELLEIYAPYVKETAITFEYDVPSLEEFENRICNTLKKYPYLVVEEISCEQNDCHSSGIASEFFPKPQILGYAYAGSFKGRAAYDWSVETTIYLRPEAKKSGIGKALYAALTESLALQGITNMNACIAFPEIEDEYLTKNSAGFHEHLGFLPVGTFHQCANKFGRWYDMIWMEKMIGTHAESPAPIKAFPEIVDKLSFNTVIVQYMCSKKQGL